MARVLISEPHVDIAALLAFVVRRLGHEPVVADGGDEQLLGADVLLVEPGDAGGRDLAVRARARVPRLALVCVSIFPPDAETAALRPDAYLVKPFALFRLEQALAAVLDGDRAGTISGP